MKRGILAGIQRKTLNKIPGMMEIGRSVDETEDLLHANPDLLHAPWKHPRQLLLETGIFALVAKLLGYAWKLSQLGLPWPQATSH
jgi:hypothetical protein